MFFRNQVGPWKNLKKRLKDPEQVFYVVYPPALNLPFTANKQCTTHTGKTIGQNWLQQQTLTVKYSHKNLSMFKHEREQLVPDSLVCNKV